MEIDLALASSSSGASSKSPDAIERQAGTRNDVSPPSTPLSFPYEALASSSRALAADWDEAEELLSMPVADLRGMPGHTSETASKPKGTARSREQTSPEPENGLVKQKQQSEILAKVCPQNTPSFSWLPTVPSSVASPEHSESRTEALPQPMSTPLPLGPTSGRVKRCRRMRRNRRGTGLVPQRKGLNPPECDSARQVCGARRKTSSSINCALDALEPYPLESLGSICCEKTDTLCYQRVPVFPFFASRCSRHHHWRDFPAFAQSFGIFPKWHMANEDCTFHCSHNILASTSNASVAICPVPIQIVPFPYFSRAVKEPSRQRSEPQSSMRVNPEVRERRSFVAAEESLSDESGPESPILNSDMGVVERELRSADRLSKCDLRHTINMKRRQKDRLEKNEFNDRNEY